MKRKAKLIVTENRDDGEILAFERLKITEKVVLTRQLVLKKDIGLVWDFVK